MSEELKACPFCGGPARIVQTTKAPWVVAICWKCDASGGAGSVKDAVESWNNRPTETALRARIAELETDTRWIPVEERLPEPGKIVIGWHAYAKKAIQYTFTVDTEYPVPGHFVDGDCCFCEDITHWMELHEPPLKDGQP
jgi:Lar family restriction alleviation protein